MSLNEQLAVEPDFNSIILSQKADLMERDAEIDRLKAELELRTRERDQAIDCGNLDFAGTDIFNLSGMLRDGSKFPELFAHLAGRGE